MSETKRLRVITVGNSPSVKGGITSVISQIMSHNWNVNDIDMKFIPTYENGNIIKKLFVYLKGYLKIRNELKNGHADVVHIHMSQTGSFTRKWYIHKICLKYNVADIIHLHSSDFVRFYEESAKNKQEKICRLLTESKYVIALGKEWEHRIKRIAPNAKIEVMNNTVHIPEVCTNQDVDCVNFLYLGVLVKRKGVIDLLKAIKRLKDYNELKSEKVFFKIGGTGECEWELKNYVKQNGLEPYVQFLGWVAGEEKINQLKTNQILVLPSYNEGLPIAILEAISYGMPVIATDVGSVAEAVCDGENGFLYQAGDIDALVKVLNKLIASPELRLKMGKKSRKLAESTFDDKLYFDALNRLYRRVVE